MACLIWARIVENNPHREAKSLAALEFRDSKRAQKLASAQKQWRSAVPRPIRQSAPSAGDGWWQRPVGHLTAGARRRHQPWALLWSLPCVIRPAAFLYEYSPTALQITPSRFAPSLLRATIAAVPILSCLLRALLCLSLVLTGWADAFALAAMAPGQSDRSTDASAPPCHGGMEMHEQDQPDHGDAVPNNGGTCCSGACECACTHAPVVVPLVMAPERSIGRASYQQAIQRESVAPPLPHLIRPPIG